MFMTTTLKIVAFLTLLHCANDATTRTMLECGERELSNENWLRVDNVFLSSNNEVRGA